MGLLWPSVSLDGASPVSLAAAVVVVVSFPKHNMASMAVFSLLHKAVLAVLVCLAEGDTAGVPQAPVC